MVSSVSSYNNRSFMSQAAHQAFSAAVSAASGNDQYNNRMYFNSGLFGSPGGFGSAAAAAAAAAAQSMSPGGGNNGGGMSHHLFDASSFRNDHGFPGSSVNTIYTFFCLGSLYQIMS
jgi:TPR repeat protein